MVKKEKEALSGYKFDVPATFRNLLTILKKDGYKIPLISKESGIPTVQLQSSSFVDKVRSKKYGDTRYRRNGTMEDVDALITAFPYLISHMPLISKEESEQLREKTKNIDDRLNDLVTREEFQELKSDIQEIKNLLLSRS